MKFFIDTASLEQIREAHDMGILDGVTTNPSLMAKEGIAGKDNILKHYKGQGVTFPLGYSNGMQAYLPTSAMIDEGGYEVLSYHEEARDGRRAAIYRRKQAGPLAGAEQGFAVETVRLKRFGELGDPEGGVVITEIESDDAWRAGLRPGDVILMINNQDIGNMDDFEELVEDIEPDRAVALRVWRNGTASFIAYTPRDRDEG